MKLLCSQDIADAINKGQENSNKYRENVLKLEPLCVIAIAFPEEYKEKVQFQTLTIQDISMYYNLQNIIVEDKEKNTSKRIFHQHFMIYNHHYNSKDLPRFYLKF